MTAVYDPLREMTDGTFDREMGELGERWEIQRNYFKLTPSCRYTHPPLGALEQIRDEIDPQQVASIDVYSYRNATDLDHADPETPTSAKFSIPYVLARSLLHGNLGLEDFSEEAIADEATKRLAETVSVKLDERYEKAFPEHWSARIEVTHEDGRTVSAECLDPPGDYRRAPDPEVLNELIEELFAYRLGEAGGRRAIETVLDIRNRDVRDVGAALRR